MKNIIIGLLQRLLGFKNYLFVFALFTFAKLKFDKNEKDFFKLLSLINSDGIILDIGANIGVMTAHFARKFKNSTVYSFEPIPGNFETLNRVAKFLNLKNVHPFQCALSNYNGSINMIMPVINQAKKQGLSHVVHNNDNTEPGDIFEVPVKKLDNFTEFFNTQKRVTAIKIDVEGHELNVFKGAINLVNKHKPIIYCELWPNQQRAQMISFMQTLNYIPKVVVKNQLHDFENQNTQNFFFVPAQ